MELKYKIKEITNIVAGRFVVVFNEFFGGILDIGVPQIQDDFSKVKIKNDTHLTFLSRINTESGNISILFMVLKDEFSNFSENPEEFFYQLFDGMEGVILETLDSMEYGDNIRINQLDFLEGEHEELLIKEMSNVKAKEFSFAPIFFKEDKKEFGGMFVIA